MMQGNGVYRKFFKIINVGDQVRYTDEYGRVCTGVLTQVGISRDYVEEKQGILRGYVEVESTDYSAAEKVFQAEAIARWCLASELTLVKTNYVQVKEGV